MSSGPNSVPPVARRHARVAALTGTSITLKIDSQCGACQAGCAPPARVVQLPSPSTGAATAPVAGAQVSIDIDSRALVVLSMLVFLWPPLVMLLSGVAVSYLFDWSELAISMAAFTGLGVAFVLLKWWSATHVNRYALRSLSVAETADTDSASDYPNG